MTGRFSAVALCLLLSCGPAIAPAHHSLATIEVSAPLWIKGTVVRYRPGAPHALLELESREADGRRVRWIAEGPFPGRMARLIEIYGGSPDSYLKPGEIVELCGFRPKAAYAVQRSYGDVDIDAAHFVHAQVMVMPGGQLRSWGPYGKLDNCVRPGDVPATWREFLDRDPLAHDLWCSAPGNKQAPSFAPPGFVAEVNRGLARACR